jgi:pimeloyl-ACP methyl ester carboxylesterase
MEIKFVDVGGLRVRYIETAGKNDIPLIILHGWGSSINSWINVASGLEKNGVKVFAPDLPGFGETPEPPHPWGLSDYVDFIRSFLGVLHIQNFFLAGHSFGGQIAIAYSVQYPQNIKKLILLSAARIIKRRKLRIKIFMIATKIGDLIFLLPPLSFLRPVAQNIWYKLAGERDYYLSSPVMKETRKRVVGEEVGPRLKLVKIPTLILWGEKDYVTLLADGRLIQEEIAGSTMRILKDAGHDINLKNYSEVALRIKEFIQIK